MKKKVDGRIRTLVENGVKTRERTMFFIVGDKGRDQVVNLHYMLSKAVVKARPSVLWCYKTDLYMSSNRKKRAKQIKKLQQRGLLTSETEDPFALFVASTNIRYCYYADTHKVLGNTYGMLVLQDFEAMTPNLLARTIETVEGGGIIVFLISSLDSLSKLYTMSMEESEEAKELRELNESLADTQPIGPLVNLCRTIDQGKAVVTFLDAASEKTLRSTVALTASRGRGKSAALGFSSASEHNPSNHIGTDLTR
eukprot:gene12697-15013_t